MQSSVVCSSYWTPYNCPPSNSVAADPGSMVSGIEEAEACSPAYQVRSSVWVVSVVEYSLADLDRVCFLEAGTADVVRGQLDLSPVEGISLAVEIVLGSLSKVESGRLASDVRAAAQQLLSPSHV